MYVLSQEKLTLKLGTDKHIKKVFINKAAGGVENDADGMTALADALSGAKKATDRTMYLVGIGETPVAEVLEGLENGEVFAYQYHGFDKHGDRYDAPQWGITLGFETDVEAKNAEYAKNREAKEAGKKSAKKVPKKAGKTGLIS